MSQDAVGGSGEGAPSGLDKANAKPRSDALWDLYRTFHETAPIGYLTVRSDGVLLDVNIAGANLFRTTPQALLGKRFTDLLGGASASCYDSIMRSVQQDEGWHQCEVEIAAADGSTVHALIHARRLAIASEIVMFATDVTERMLAERKLKDSEQRYRDLADRLAEGVFEADVAGNVSYANRKAMSVLGLDEDDLARGIKVFDVIAPGNRAMAIERMGRVLRQEDVGSGEYLMLRKDGTTFPALVHSLAVVRDGRVVGVRGILIDISERKRAETAVQESERRYRELADLLGAGVFETDTGGILTYANRKGLAAYGLDENAVRDGFSVFSVIDPEETKLAVDNFSRVLDQEDIGPIEYKMVRKDGTAFPGLTYVSAIVRDDRVVGVRGVVVDISDRKRIENALRESERKYRELTDQLDEGVYEIDPKGVITYANRKGLAYLGLTEDDLQKGVNGFDLIVDQDAEAVRSRYARTLQGEDIGAVEYVFRRRDGSTFPALTHSSVILRDGECVGVRGVIIDISDLKRTQNALKESEQKYRELSDLLDEGVFEVDLTGRFTYANRKGMAYLGLDQNDIDRGLEVFDIVASQDMQSAREAFTRALQFGDSGAVEFVISRRDGTSLPVLSHGSTIERNGAVVGIRAVVFDISEMKQTERALRESEQRFRTFVKSLHEGIWVLDKDDITTFVNPRMAEMLGYSEEEMIGKPVYSFNDDEWREFTIDSLRRRKAGVSEQLEGTMIRKDGGRVHALLEASPILDEKGNYVGSIAGVQDITERKHAEERLKQAMGELDRSNKELEQFAYVTSHDLREPLRMMTSFSQSLEKRYKDKLDSAANEYIHFIVDGASRMQRLIDDILIYSRVTTRALPFAAVDMSKVFQDALFNLKAALDESKAEITCDALPVIHADPSQMAQVLQNLMGNALKFSREGVAPKVHVSAMLEAGEWIFSVKDNGIGIDPELFGRLFNLFQRLHPPDKYPGTGVGLAVTKKIVERHGGRIWVESQPGAGSTFRFSIPARG